MTNIDVHRTASLPARYRQSLAIAAWVTLLIPSSGYAQSAPAADRPPSVLLQLAESAASLFDAAYASDWRSASERMRSVSDAASMLPTDLPRPDVVSHLKAAVLYAADGVNAHDRIETMDEANTMTRLVADLSAMFQAPMPYEAAMLGYYGRQLEFGLVSSRPSTLSDSATALQATWSRLQSIVERRGHIDDAKRFTDIVAQLIAARRPADRVAPTRAELAAAERIGQLLSQP